MRFSLQKEAYVTAFHAILLGILQGVTEFLPISSSGHLVIVQHYLKEFQQPGILFDVLLHVGTLAAVFIYYWRDIVGILKALIIPLNALEYEKQKDFDRHKSQRRLALLIFVGTIPTVVIGLLLRDVIEVLFSSVKLTALMLFVTGVLLALAARVKKTERKISSVRLKDSVLIGFVQGLAIVPGISRSGATIATGLFRNIDGEEAARFSFLLSIPAILGAAILEIPGTFQIQAHEIVPYILGILSAMLTGVLAIKFLIRILRQKRLIYFAYYCWLLGSVALMTNLCW